MSIQFVSEPMNSSLFANFVGKTSLHLSAVCTRHYVQILMSTAIVNLLDRGTVFKRIIYIFLARLWHRSMFWANTLPLRSWLIFSSQRTRYGNAES